MKSFNQITDIGRGRLLYTSRHLEKEEHIYLASTGEYVSCKHRDEIILSAQEAIQWAVRNRLCSGKRDFIAKCVEQVRLPFKTVVPKVRLIRDAQLERPTLEVRAQELIQNPTYNCCLINHSGGLETLQLDEDQRVEVLRLVTEITSSDFYAGSPVKLGPETTLYDGNTDMHAHGFRIIHETQIYDLSCFTALAPQDLPHDIRHHIRDLEIDESTWLKIPDFYEIWSRKTRLQFALIAIAVCIHFQLNYENVYSPGENPLEIFQGIDIAGDMEPVLRIK